jgi:rod shape-determining protein MreB
LTQRIVLDVGSANTRVYVRDRGVVLSQPSVVCFSKTPGPIDDAQVAVVGAQANALLGRTPQHLTVVRPIQRGVITDCDAMEFMIRAFAQQAHIRQCRTRPLECVLSVSSLATSVEQRGIRDAVLSATGAREMRIVDSSLCAAFGAGLPVMEPIGSLVVDIGAGTTSVAVIALGGIVCQEITREGGVDLDEAIVHHVRHAYGVQLGEHTAEHVKQNVASAHGSAACRSIRVVGNRIANGLPHAVELTSAAIADALSASLNRIVETIKHVLERTPPELLNDIARRGIVLTGGGALLANLGSWLCSELGLSVHIADDPLNCVARGAWRLCDISIR